MSEWKKFEMRPFGALNQNQAPFNGGPFLACIFGRWVGEAIYARHYDGGIYGPPGKYEFFYVTEDPEKEGWKIFIKEDPFPITHWMPLPKPPEES